MKRKITVRLDYDVEEMLDKLVNEYGYRVTDVVNMGIRQFFDFVVKLDDGEGEHGNSGNKTAE